MTSIIFVCLDNICRSPIAKAVAKDLAHKRGLDLLISSAGTSNQHEGERACENSIKVAKNHGLDLMTRRAKRV
ncbi:MAG: hypothetical protein WCR69_06580 [Sulfuricurvum sp.]